MPDRDLLRRLIADGLVRVDGESLRTTRRWQAAMARATYRLVRAGDDGGDGGDLRLPIALALVELYREQLDDEAIAEAVGAMLPVEEAELERGLH